MDGLVKIGDYPIHHDNKVHVHKVKRNSCPYCTFVDESGNTKLHGTYIIQNNTCTMSITLSGMLKVSTKDSETFTKISYCPMCRRKI